MATKKQSQSAWPFPVEGEKVKKPTKKELAEQKAVEQEKLIQTLKFTPRDYKIEIVGRGGEIYWGRVDRKIYDLFKEKKIDIEQYAGGWDEELFEDIPETEQNTTKPEPTVFEPPTRVPRSSLILEKSGVRDL